MKILADLCLYCVWFLRVVHFSLAYHGIKLAPMEEVVMGIVGILVAGALVIAGSAIAVEAFKWFCWQGIKGAMHFPDNWHGQMSEDEIP